MSKKLSWETRKYKVCDLIPLNFNPRTITEEKREKLIQSLEKFNLAEIPAVNTDLTIIGGNQRVFALHLMGRGEEEIDVRYPNRRLSEKELKEYAIISNTHAGEWDALMLDTHFGEFDLEEMGVQMPELDIDHEMGEASALENDPFNDAGITAQNKYAVIVTAEDEADQEQIYKKLLGMGYNCKVIVV